MVMCEDMSCLASTMSIKTTYQHLHCSRVTECDSWYWHWLRPSSEVCTIETSQREFARGPRMVSWRMALCRSCFLSYVPISAASFKKNCNQSVSNMDALIPSLHLCAFFLCSKVTEKYRKIPTTLTKLRKGFRP